MAMPLTRYPAADGHPYPATIHWKHLDQVQAATPATGEIEACADCGVPLTDDTRDFFYSDHGTLYCSVCRDLETSEPHQAEPVEKKLTPEEIANRFASAFPTWHVELVPTREAYKTAARSERPEGPALR